jgi:uncharacterized damage-inducible protein DinB
MVELVTKEETLAKLAESRRALHHAIEGLSEEEMTRIQVEGVWTIKDILGHIASWEETCLEPLRRYADGAPFEVEVIEDYLTWNDEQAARKRDVPLDAILDELATVRQELIEAASRLSAGQRERRVPFSWGGEGTIAEVLDVFYRHELEHVRSIQRWREAQTNKGSPVSATACS